MRTIAPIAAPATAINDPSRKLPALPPVDFVGTAAPLALCVPLLPTAEEMDGAEVVAGIAGSAGMDVLPSEDVTRTVVAPVELPVEDTETETVNVAEDAETEAVVEVADAETVVEVAETDAMVAGAATEGVQQERYEVVRTAVPEYRGHPGTSVLGGARPPPQSSGSHTSPVFGSYQCTIPSAQWVKL